jgi:hypothetical protein
MRRSIAKLICLSLVFFSVALNASAYPYQHPKTGILFTDAIGRAKLIDVKDYEKEHPGLGAGVMYRADTFKADVFIYDMKKSSILADVTAPVITGQFEQAIGDVLTLKKRGMYKNIIAQIKKETLQVGAFPFLAQQNDVFTRQY